MAESADDPALFSKFEPEERGVRSLESFNVASRLAFPRIIRTTPYRVVRDHDFDAVIDGCAGARARPRQHLDQRNDPPPLVIAACSRWVTRTTVEVYDGEKLIGGLYGVNLGRAFFGESMFHRATGRLEDRARASGGAVARGAGYELLGHAVHHLAPEELRRGRGPAGSLQQASGKRRARSRGRLRLCPRAQRRRGRGVLAHRALGNNASFRRAKNADQLRELARRTPSRERRCRLAALISVRRTRRSARVAGGAPGAVALENHDTTIPSAIFYQRDGGAS